MFTWARDKDSELNVLTPSQELTHKLIQNQMLNIKVMKHNLFSARGLPEFLDSKWVKVLQGRWLTSMLSSPEYTRLSLTTKQQRCLETLNSALDIQNLPKLSGTTGTGLLCIVCSNMQCGSSTPIESQSSFSMVNMSPLTSNPLMQEAKSTSSTLIK